MAAIISPVAKANEESRVLLEEPVRKLFFWKLKQRELRLGERTVLMGVLNVTPDSFSDGGKFSDPDRAFARAIELEEQGADIIDVGAESTKPGSQRVSEAEEIRRLIPVLKRLQGQLSIPISVDTYKAEVATRALDLGVEIINDPTGLTFEPQLARTVSNYNAGLILNHMRGRPETWAKLAPMPDPIGTIGRELEATINRTRMVGIDKTRVVIDPGLGFGKRKEQNSLILGRLQQLAALDYPIMVGPSRKSFLAHEDPNETKFATAAAVTAAILAGAHVIRVHDVREMRAAADVADEIQRAE
jgi:dihydropteroate synthase